MKHLVLIAGVYYPQPSPTGKCAGQYVSLLKDEYDIDIIYIQSNLGKTYGVTVDGETLFSITNWRVWIEMWFQKRRENSNNKFLCRIYMLGVILMKVIGRLQSTLLFPGNMRWFYKKAYRTLIMINKRYPIDVIFTVNSPFAAHLAGRAYKTKYPNVNWITYTVDPFFIGFEHCISRQNYKYTKALFEEKSVLASADTNFLSEEVYEYCKKLYENIIEKTFPLPYLLLKNENSAINLFDPQKINLVYAGRFYKEIRNPEILLKTFLLVNNKDLLLHLYVSSDCEELINDYVEKSSGRIIRHNLVEHEEILKILNSADILINVGNTIPEFKPSKIFE